MERLSGIGLTDVRLENVAEEIEFRSGLDMWNRAMSSNPLAGILVAGLTGGQRCDVRAVLDHMLRSRSVEAESPS